VEKEGIAMRRTLSENRFKCLLVLFFVIAIWGCVALLGSNVMAANIMKIGMKEEPKTLNIWLANDRWSLRVLSFIYQPLYYRDPETLDQVPWLAEALPVYDQATLSYTVKLRPAKWSDGSELTSEDVAFTGNLIKAFKVPRRNAYWKFIEKIETPDKRTVKFYLKEPMAVFLERTLATPIVQKKEWVKVAEEAKATEKPLASLLQHKVEKPVGSGPFVIKEQRGGAYLYVEKNKYFFGAGKTIAGRKLGPYIDGIIFKYYGTSDAAVLGLKKGSIDMYWWGIEPGYLEDLKKEKDIQLFSNERSALYYMGFNVRKPPFNDPNLRRAIATLVDKDFIITRILQGHGTKMTSIIPPGNRFYYCPDLPTYGDGLSREERVKKAYDILRNAGYDWEVPPVDRSGKVVKGEQIRLPNGQAMEKFLILTPPADYDPARAMSGMIIQEWLKEVGMPASSKPMAFKSLVEQVSVRHDFDAFILGYGRLSLDPDYLRSFFHSSQDRPRGGNKAGYKNPEFDRIADESSRMMDPQKRRELIWEMQKIIMRDVPYVPLYNPSLIEAVRKDKFTGWVQMLEGIGNFWSFCQVRAK
jgi:peptide/nickel transport system substrate-binding protein